MPPQTSRKGHVEAPKGSMRGSARYGSSNTSNTSEWCDRCRRSGRGEVHGRERSSSVTPSKQGDLQLVHSDKGRTPAQGRKRADRSCASNGNVNRSLSRCGEGAGARSAQPSAKRHANPRGPHPDVATTKIYQAPHPRHARRLPHLRHHRHRKVGVVASPRKTSLSIFAHSFSSAS